MIFHVAACVGFYCAENFSSKTELTKSHRGGGESDLIAGQMWFERDDAFPPGERLGTARQFRRFRHDAAGGEIVWIALQETPRHKHGALVIATSEKILRLFGEMAFAPNSVSPVTAKSHGCDHKAGRQTARPAAIEIAALERANVPEAVVVICGILHCV
jgi:hypothetical protein